MGLFSDPAILRKLFRECLDGHRISIQNSLADHFGAIVMMFAFDGGFFKNSESCHRVRLEIAKPLSGISRIDIDVTPVKLKEHHEAHKCGCRIGAGKRLLFAKSDNVIRSLPKEIRLMPITVLIMHRFFELGEAEIFLLLDDSQMNPQMILNGQIVHLGNHAQKCTAPPFFSGD